MVRVCVYRLFVSSYLFNDELTQAGIRHVHILQFLAPLPFPASNSYSRLKNVGKMF